MDIIKIILMNVLQSLINKRVDTRFDERMDDMLFSLTSRRVPNEQAKKEMRDFILQQKELGNTKLSVLDLMLGLNLPAGQVQNILDVLEAEEKIKEINYV